HPVIPPLVCLWPFWFISRPRPVTEEKRHAEMGLDLPDRRAGRRHLRIRRHRFRRGGDREAPLCALPGGLRGLAHPGAGAAGLTRTAPRSPWAAGTFAGRPP